MYIHMREINAIEEVESMCHDRVGCKSKMQHAGNPPDIATDAANG